MNLTFALKSKHALCNEGNLVGQKLLVKYMGIWVIRIPAQLVAPW